MRRTGRFSKRSGGSAGCPDAMSSIGARRLRIPTEKAVFTASSPKSGRGFFTTERSRRVLFPQAGDVADWADCGLAVLRERSRRCC